MGKRNRPFGSGASSSGGSGFRRRGRRGRFGKRKGRVDLKQEIWKLVERHVPDEAVRLIRLRDAWDEIAGRRLAPVTWPALVHRNRLVIHVRDGQWRHELTYLAGELLKQVQAQCAEARIDRLEFHLGRVDIDRRMSDGMPDPKVAVEVDPPRRRPALVADPPAATVEALGEVEDTELRDAMAAARYLLGRPGSVPR